MEFGGELELGHTVMDDLRVLLWLRDAHWKKIQFGTYLTGPKILSQSNRDRVDGIVLNVGQ